MYLFVAEIYKEALETTKTTEGKKFNVKFGNFIIDLKESLENQSPNGLSSNTSCKLTLSTLATSIDYSIHCFRSN